MGDKKTMMFRHMVLATVALCAITHALPSTEEDDWDANDVLLEGGGGGRRGGATKPFPFNLKGKGKGTKPFPFNLKGKGKAPKGFFPKGMDDDDDAPVADDNAPLSPVTDDDDDADDAPLSPVADDDGADDAPLRPRLREMETEIHKLRDTTHDQWEQIDKLKRGLITEEKVFKKFKKDAARAADHQQEYMKKLSEKGFENFANQMLEKTRNMIRASKLRASPDTN